MNLPFPEPMLVTAKHALEWTLLHTGAAGLTRALHRGRSLVLAFHNIVPEAAPWPAQGDRSLHLGQRAFRRQLELLARTHEVVPLTAILAPATSRSQRPQVAITFDDAYLGAVTVGVEELARLGMPATIFVAPAFIGGKTFWWDCYADPATGTLDAGLRQEALTHLAGQDAAVRAWADKKGIAAAEVPAHARVASEDDLRKATATGVTLGSHTWSHPNLTRLGPQDLERELGRPLAWLRERFAAVLPWLAYPYGLASPAVEAAAARAGYAASLRVDGGWLPRETAGLRAQALPRLNIPAGLSHTGFALRTAGLLA